VTDSMVFVHSDERAGWLFARSQPTQAGWLPAGFVERAKSYPGRRVGSALEFNRGNHATN
jgi:hypothetical protein